MVTNTETLCDDTCEVSLSVCLIFIGDNLDPNAISIHLNCPPTKSWKKGDSKFIGITKKTSDHSWGGWILESMETQLDKLNESILELIEKTGIDRTDLSEVIGTDISAKIEVSIFGELTHPIFILPIVFEKTKESCIPIIFNYFGE